MSYIKQFRPLTSEDVETIRKQQGNKNIAVLLEKKPVFSEKKEINFELKIMPELNCLVEGYYILKNSLEIKDNLPFIMTQEVYDAHVNRELEIKNRPIYLTPIFEEWVDDNFRLSLFGRYEYWDDPDGNRGSWTKNELWDKWNKHEYAYYMSKSGNPVVVVNNNFKKELKERKVLNNIAYSLCDNFAITELPENIKTLIKNDNVIVVELPILKYEGHAFCVKDFTIDEVYEKINKGEKFAIYLVKEDLKTIRGINLKKESIMEELKCGDVVCLKSGSPNMTIDSITDSNKITHCLWFVGSILCKGTFAVDSLTIPETSKDSKEKEG